MISQTVRNMTRKFGIHIQVQMPNSEDCNPWNPRNSSQSKLLHTLKKKKKKEEGSFEGEA